MPEDFKGKCHKRVPAESKKDNLIKEQATRSATTKVVSSKEEEKEMI